MAPPSVAQVHLRRMAACTRGEQLLLAQKFVVVLLGLGIEARVVIGIEGLGPVAVLKIDSFKRRTRRLPGVQSQLSSPRFGSA